MQVMRNLEFTQDLGEVRETGLYKYYLANKK
jgi:hypothetical protein